MDRFTALGTTEIRNCVVPTLSRLLENNVLKAGCCCWRDIVLNTACVFTIFTLYLQYSHLQHKIHYKYVANWPLYEFVFTFFATECYWPWSVGWWWQYLVKILGKIQLFLISNVCNSSSMCRNVDYYHFHGSFVTALPSSKKLIFKWIDIYRRSLDKIAVWKLEVVRCPWI